jgi:hypothetical protein
MKVGSIDGRIHWNIIMVIIKKTEANMKGEMIQWRMLYAQQLRSK